MIADTGLKIFDADQPIKSSDIYPEGSDFFYAAELQEYLKQRGEHISLWDAYKILREKAAELALLEDARKGQVPTLEMLG